MVGLIAVSDAMLYLSGRELVTPFQLQSYTPPRGRLASCHTAFAAIIVAPAGEELMFRGYFCSRLRAVGTARRGQRSS